MMQEFEVQTFCRLVFTDFPSDAQTCFYNVTSQTLNVRLSAIHHFSSPDFAQPDEFVALGWHFADADDDPNVNASSSGRYLSLGFHMTRDVTIFLYPVILPSLIISMVTVLMFAMESTSDRVNMGVSHKTDQPTRKKLTNHGPCSNPSSHHSFT
jgi:hypothetical protein